jgi:hypothetical protein
MGEKLQHMLNCREIAMLLWPRNGENVCGREAALAGLYPDGSIHFFWYL